MRFAIWVYGRSWRLSLFSSITMSLPTSNTFLLSFFITTTTYTTIRSHLRNPYRRTEVSHHIRLGCICSNRIDAQLVDIKSTHNPSQGRVHRARPGASSTSPIREDGTKSKNKKGPRRSAEHQSDVELDRTTHNPMGSLARKPLTGLACCEHHRNLMRKGHRA